jgi:Spy/CpxP family protein refolding chaperone
MKQLWIVGLLAIATQPLWAQMHGYGQHRDAPSPNPYAAFGQRGIKALSDQQVADLRAGRGMGLALAAELNGYPGPMHVLEHAEALELTPDIRSQVEDLIGRMKAEAIPIGERIIAEEVALDRLFAGRQITQPALEAATSRIGIAQAQLRATHLSYHLAMRDLLTPSQSARYEILRGYPRP